MVEHDPTTLYKYRVHLEEFIAWLERHGLSLLSAQRRDVARHLAYLKSDQRLWRDSRQRPIRPAARPSSRKGRLAALRAFYRHCAVMDYIAHDPTFGVETPKVTIKRGITLTRRGDSVAAVIDAKYKRLVSSRERPKGVDQADLCQLCGIRDPLQASRPFGACLPAHRRGAGPHEHCERLGPWSRDGQTLAFKRLPTTVEECRAAVATLVAQPGQSPRRTGLIELRVDVISDL